MNTSDVYLRWFECDENGEEIPETAFFQSLADLSYNGVPINDDGDNLENDGLVWVLNTKDEDYEVLAY